MTWDKYLCYREEKLDYYLINDPSSVLSFYFKISNIWAYIHLICLLISRYLIFLTSFFHFSTFNTDCLHRTVALYYELQGVPVSPAPGSAPQLDERT